MPSLGKVQLGRPNPEPIQPLNFLSQKGKKTQFYPELYALQRYETRFSISILIYLKKIFKNVIKKACQKYAIYI